MITEEKTISDEKEQETTCGRIEISDEGEQDRSETVLVECAGDEYNKGNNATIILKIIKRYIDLKLKLVKKLGKKCVNVDIILYNNSSYINKNAGN